MSLRRPIRRAALVVSLSCAVVGCGDSDPKAVVRTRVPSAVSTCDIDPSIEQTPDDEDRIGEVAGALVGKGPCLVDAARRWLLAHPKAREGTPAGRAIVRAVGLIVGTLVSKDRETALDVLLESEAFGDAMVRREALIGLATVRKHVNERIEAALAEPDGVEHERALALREALGPDSRAGAASRAPSLPK